MTYIPSIRIWPPPKYPLLHKARTIFQSEGKEALISWVKSLPPIEKGDLAAEVVNFIAESTGRDPEDVALELYFGKGFKL